MLKLDMNARVASLKRLLQVFRCFYICGSASYGNHESASGPWPLNTASTSPGKSSQHEKTELTP